MIWRAGQPEYASLALSRTGEVVIPGVRDEALLQADSPLSGAVRAGMLFLKTPLAKPVLGGI